jgi:hypothetical protein
MKHRWLVRARFWKLILSQNTEGYWDASSTVAFALEARQASETTDLKPSLMMRLKDIVGGATEAFDDDRNVTEAVFQGWQGDGDAAAAPENEAAALAAATVDLDSNHDCPLTCSVSAITASLPPRLGAVLGADAGVEVMRVWSTMLAVSVLERMNVSWLWGDGCVGGLPRLAACASRPVLPLTAPAALACQRAVPGAGAHGRRWRARVGGAPRGGAPSARGGAGGRRAAETRQPHDHALAPRLRQEHRTAAPQRGHPRPGAPVALRSASRIACDLADAAAFWRRSRQMGLSHLHRTCTELARAVITQHSTFATFLSEPLDGLQRWQSALCARVCAACVQRLTAHTRVLLRFLQCG